MSCTLKIFPHITGDEFKTACADLTKTFRQHGKEQDRWLTVEVIPCSTSDYLRITTRSMLDTDDPPASEDPDNEVDEQDEEALGICKSPIFMQYDIVLSAVYQVPVLYVDIIDQMHRFPPTMDTLYKYIIPRYYESQAEHVGVIGGISLQHHPVTDKPMFFIHPCQTADLMTAIVGDRDVDAFMYLMIWLGAIGKCVGLNVPLSLGVPPQNGGSATSQA